MDEQNVAPEQAVKKAGGGKSKLILIIVGVLILLGGGAFAYTKLGGSNSTINGVVNKVTLNSNCKYNDPDLCKFMNNWKAVKQLTMTTNSSDSTGKSITSTFIMDGDNKSQMISSTAGKEEFNMITIDKTTYTKDYSDNKWFKYTSTDDDSTSTYKSDIDFDDKAENVEDKTTYEKIGKEACGNFTCFKYKVIDPAVTGGADYIYFDDKEYLLRKTRNESSDGALYEATYDYGKTSVTEPSPTKEGSPLGGTEAYGSTSEAEAAANALRSQELYNNMPSTSEGTTGAINEYPTDTESTDSGSTDGSVSDDSVSPSE